MHDHARGIYGEYILDELVAQIIYPHQNFPAKSNHERQT
jgi:hypothetical protein